MSAMAFTIKRQSIKRHPPFHVLCSVATPASDQHQTTGCKCLQLQRTDVGSLKGCGQYPGSGKNTRYSLRAARQRQSEGSLCGYTVQSDTQSLNTTDNSQCQQTFAVLLYSDQFVCVCVCVCMHYIYIYIIFTQLVHR